MAQGRALLRLFFIGPPPARCRGAACRSRHGTSDWYRPTLKWDALPNCHCEGASRPWQSHAPTSEFAEVALLSTRVLRDCHVGLRPPRNDKSEAIAIVSYPARIGDVSRGVEDAAPTTHDRRLPVILPARFCGKAPPQSSSGSLLCFCCLIQISITSLCGSSFTSRTCQRTGRPWMETSFFVRYRSCRAVFITSFASYRRL